MWGKPHRPSIKDSEHMRVLSEVIVKIILQNISIYQTIPPISYTIKIVGQEVDKNNRLRLEESWIHLLNTFQPNGLNLKL